MNSVIAENVKAIIFARGLKKGAVAEMAGYDKKTFSNMLNGRKIITAVDVEKLAVALNVTPNQLFGLDKEE